MTRCEIHNVFAKPLTARQQLAKSRAERRRMTRRRVIHTVGALLTVAMSLATFYIVTNYRVVHDPKTGTTRVMTIAEVDAAKAGITKEVKSTKASPTPAKAVKPAPAQPAPVQDAAKPTPRSAVPTPEASTPDSDATTAEDPEGHVTSFFGIEVKNKDFYPRKNG